MNLASIFSQYGASLLILLTMSFKWKFEILTKSDYQSFPLWTVLWYLWKTLYKHNDKDFLHHFLLILVVIFKSMIYFELICVYDEELVKFHSLQMDVWCSSTTVEISLFPLSWWHPLVKKPTNHICGYFTRLFLSNLYPTTVFNMRMSWLLWIYLKFWSWIAEILCFSKNGFDYLSSSFHISFRKLSNFYKISCWIFDWNTLISIEQFG